MKTEFDPDVLEAIVHETLAWREAQPVRPDVWETYDQLLKGVEGRYPGLIRWPTKWYYDRSAGFLQAIAILYVSASEYMAITGTPVATDGGSGPFPGEIYDWVIDGEINSFEAGEFAVEPTRPGQLDYLPRGQMKGAAIDSHYWAFEYGRGPILFMWPTTIVGTFMDLDFGNLFEMFKAALREFDRNLLRPGTYPTGPQPCHWHNWAGNCEANAERYFTPSVQSDLVAITKQDREENERRRTSGEKPLRIRPLGGGFSWSDLVPTEDWIVDMTRMNRVLAVDRENHTITVECGMRIGDLTAQTARYRMVLHSPTVITLVTVGGMIGTGAHGGGMTAGSFPDWVTEFTFVRADGEIVTLRKDDPADRDDIRAAQVALGSMGFLYSVTIQCEPTYNVESIDSHIDLRTAIEQIPERVSKSDFVEYFWFPTTAKMWVKESSRTGKLPNVSWLTRTAWNLWDAVREKYFGPPALRFLAKHIPFLMPLMMKVALFITPTRSAVEDANYALHYEDYYPKCFDMSLAIPLENARDAWSFIVDQVESEAAQGRYPVTLIAHSRFLNGSDSFLSPTRNRDSCYIEILCVADTPNWRPFFERMEVEMRGRFDGRPHWGKLYWDAKTLHAAYGDDMDRFLEIRERWDPDRLFLNDFLERDVFQLGEKMR